MQVKQALIKALPEIIEQSVKPMERIEGIKILHVEGLHGARNGADANGVPQGSIADQAVDAALRYRAQAPLLDALMRELGLSGTDLTGLGKMIENGQSKAKDD
jgi:uncharacterized membrane protein YqiK